MAVFYIYHHPIPTDFDNRGVRFYNKSNSAHFDSFFGDGEIIRKTLESAEYYAKYTRLLLMIGEKGCSQDDLAFFMYNRSKYVETPFIMLDCAEISEKKWESLFTDVHSPLFLGECFIYLKNINVLTPERIDYILCFLHSPMFQRTQIILSCYNDESLCLIEDFFNYLKYEESCSILEIPSLRKRPDDIPSLSLYYINEFNIERGKQIMGLTSEGYEKICTFPWPNNSSQLKRVIQELVTTTTSSYISLSDIERILLMERHTMSDYVQDSGVLDLKKPLHEIERQIVEIVLSEENMNQTKAAKRLGISRSTLWRMIK